MANISVDSMDFFTEDSYEEYLNKNSPISNERLRDKNETIFDALISDDADFRKTPQGDEIVAAIRNYK